MFSGHERIQKESDNAHTWDSHTARVLTLHIPSPSPYVLRQRYLIPEGAHSSEPQNSTIPVSQATAGDMAHNAPTYVEASQIVGDAIWTQPHAGTIPEVGEQQENSGETNHMQAMQREPFPRDLLEW